MGIDTGLDTLEPKPVATSVMERETGIEPASSAWKAGGLPLNYSRPADLAARATRSEQHVEGAIAAGGGGWIRTNVGVSQQIYSLPPLTTRASLQS